MMEMFVLRSGAYQDASRLLGVFSTEEAAIHCAQREWNNTEQNVDYVEVFGFTVDEPLASYQSPVWSRYA